MVGSNLFAYLVMAPTSKPKEKRRRNCFFNSSCCFGSNQERDHDDGTTLFKFNSGKKSSQRAKTVPVSDSTFMKVMNLSKETHMLVTVEGNDHKLLDKIIVNKDMIKEKSKSTTNKLAHSVSMPPSRKKTKVAADGGVRENKAKAGEGEFDSLVGALMLITALVVMLIWGKVSAILCTAAWFYFLPRLTRLNNMNNHGMRLGNGADLIDLGSMECKKKVVLQGFLDRN